MKSFLQRWLIGTVAVLVATYIIPGIDYARWIDLIVATLVLGILNTFLRPILMVLSLPLLVFTLGLFMLVINALLLLLVSWLMGPKFHVAGFWSAFFGALLISIITLLLNSMTKSGDSRMEVKRGTNPPPPPNRRDDGGSGPVIDV
ncbi:MAG: phage holin family protein [Limisphaerales bacterium]